jgi:hypothetical protein
VFVLTDIENEPDDAMSLVRYLTYANHFETEALVATTSVHQKNHVAPQTLTARSATTSRSTRRASRPVNNCSHSLPRVCPPMACSPSARAKTRPAPRR